MSQLLSGADVKLTQSRDGTARTVTDQIVMLLDSIASSVLAIALRVNEALLKESNDGTH